MPPVEASKSGVCRANLRDVFGYNSGSEQISDSFVLGDDVHHIALTVSGAALKFYKKKHEQQNYRVKIVPFDLRNKFVRSFFLEFGLGLDMTFWVGISSCSCFSGSSP